MVSDPELGKVIVVVGCGINHFEFTTLLIKLQQLVCAVLIGTPMWNYSVPYVLKQYIDTIVQPGINLNEMENLTDAALVRNS